jgi:cysteine desulfurase
MVDLGTTETIVEPREASVPAGPKPIYLDHHATTPVDPRVVEVVLYAMTDAFGNANSVDHAYGEAAAELVNTASGSVAALVGAEQGDVHFTSGSTEAITLALAHAISKRRGATLRVALTRVEHRAVLDAVAVAAASGAIEPLWIDVDARARLSPAGLDVALESDVDLICLMAANNEVGTIYPIQDVATLAHKCGAAILVDATQAAGRLDLRVRDWGLDYLMFSAHKIYGPKGVGALVAPRPNKRRDIAGLTLGHQGTPNVPGIAGFGEACRLRRIEMADDEPRITSLRDRLETALTHAVPNLVVNGDLACRLSHNLHISAPGVPNDAVVGRLRKKVAISTGAACTSGAQAPSHVLRAMGLPEDIQEGSLRISLGKFNTQEEIDRAAIEIADAINAVRALLDGRLQ